MHLSAIDRIARGEGTKLEPIKDHPLLAALLSSSYPHKRVRPTASSSMPRMLAAVRRLQERGSAPTKETVIIEMRAAAARLSKELRKRVNPLHPSKLRHSFLSWGTEMGEKVTRTGKEMSVRTRQTSRTTLGRPARSTTTGPLPPTASCR